MTEISQQVCNLAVGFVLGQFMFVRFIAGLILVAVLFYVTYKIFELLILKYNLKHSFHLKNAEQIQNKKTRSNRTR